MKGSGEHCGKIHEDGLMDAWASSQVCQAVVVVEVLSSGGGFEDGSGVRRFSREEGEVPDGGRSSFLVALSSYHPLRRLSESNSIAMSPVPVAALSDPRSNTSPTSTPPPPPNPPITTEEVNVDELASTVEDPPLGQLTLFKSVFGVGVSLARYIVDDPLWPILAAAGLPCSFCVHSKKSGSCSVVPHLARCSNCDDKKPFLEAHGDPGQHTWFSLLPEQWRTIADKIESSTSSARALLELSPLNDQDRLEEDHLKLQDFICHQPKLPTVAEPAPSGTRPPLVPDKVLSIPKKRKRTVRMGEASSSKRKRFVEQDLGVGDADYRRNESSRGSGAPYPKSWGRSQQGFASLTISWGPPASFPSCRHLLWR
ncbi:hypothetical protein C8R41DRAFT_969779 [Lentinula lateritia]|uniref:Uncharacterized protein n=1 Tax=Lentinula lateritia TaxID=40482 RepID=A0ABQ8VTX9_9AGAR|nr:hypothetical protein C8R41DRAFT_969779 [Lentinula lateritia]